MFCMHPIFYRCGQPPSPARPPRATCGFGWAASQESWSQIVLLHVACKAESVHGLHAKQLAQDLAKEDYGRLCCWPWWRGPAPSNRLLCHLLLHNLCFLCLLLPSPEDMEKEIRNVHVSLSRQNNVGFALAEKTKTEKLPKLEGAPVALVEDLVAKVEAELIDSEDKIALLNLAIKF